MRLIGRSTPLGLEPHKIWGCSLLTVSPCNTHIGLSSIRHLSLKSSKRAALCRGSRHDRLVLTFVESNSRVIRLVNTGNLDRWSGGASSGTFDLKLEALDVELGLADVAFVETNVLHTDKVLAWRNFLLDRPLQAILLPGAPVVVHARAVATQRSLVDLHPVAAAVVGLDTRRRLRDVDEARTGVLDELVVEQLEANLVTGLDGVGCGVSCCGALVAAEVVRVHNIVREGRIVGVGVLARVRVLSSNGGTVDDQAVEDVVRLRKGCGDREDC